MSRNNKYYDEDDMYDYDDDDDDYPKPAPKAKPKSNNKNVAQTPQAKGISKPSNTIGTQKPSSQLPSQKLSNTKASTVIPKDKAVELSSSDSISKNAPPSSTLIQNIIVEEVPSITKNEVDLSSDTIFQKTTNANNKPLTSSVSYEDFSDDDCDVTKQPTKQNIQRSSDNKQNITIIVTGYELIFTFTTFIYYSVGF